MIIVGSGAAGGAATVFTLGFFLLKKVKSRAKIAPMKQGRPHFKKTKFDISQNIKPKRVIKSKKINYPNLNETNISITNVNDSSLNIGAN